NYFELFRTISNYLELRHHFVQRAAHGTTGRRNAKQRSQRWGDVMYCNRPMVASCVHQSSVAPEYHWHMGIVVEGGTMRCAATAAEPVGIVHDNHIAGIESAETVTHALIDAIAAG